MIEEPVDEVSPGPTTQKVCQRCKGIAGSWQVDEAALFVRVGGPLKQSTLWGWGEDPEGWICDSS